MDEKRQRIRKKRRIRNLVSIGYCLLQLLLVVAAFRGGGKLLELLFPKTPPVSADYEMTPDEEPGEEHTGPVVCIDAGHGGKDNGSDCKGRYEKDDNLKIALAVAAYLKEKNVTVVMTRETDVFLKLSERCDVANEAGADYLISLHRNDGEGRGVETWVRSDANEETKSLAERIMKGLSDAGVQKDRGVKRGTQKGSDGDYYLNLNSKMPSCIVELGFINNDNDNKLFDDQLERYAAAIGDAVLAVYGEFGAPSDNTPSAGGTPSDDGAASAGAASSGDNTPSAGAASSEDNAPSDDGAASAGTASSEDNTPSAGGGQAAHTQIANVEQLDAVGRDWGLGSHTDEWNRPLDAIAAQEEYGDKSALFIKENEKTIYLTVDEGYEYGFSESILNTLKEKGVKAVFFVTEPYAKEQPELVKRMIDEGHVVGNHSVTHPSKGLPSQTLAEQKEEVMGNHAYIKENFDYEMRLFRYPAGKFSEQSLALVNNCNYTSVFWSFAYLDYDVNNQPDAAESLKKLVDKLHPGAIYLLHGESETNTEILGDFIDAAREQGYTFGTL